ncbi:MAG: permease-like cell division protein FtsX [bacterium]
MKISKLLTHTSIVLCFLLLGISLILLYNIDGFIASMEDRLTLSAFLMENISDEKLVEHAMGDIEKMSVVQEVTYISKENALDEFLLRSPEFAEQVKVLGTNPLPASFEIKVKKPFKLDNIRNLITKLTNLEVVKSVEYPELEIKKLSEVRNIFNRLDIGLGITVLVFTIVFVGQLYWCSFKTGEHEKLLYVLLQGFAGGIISVAILYGLFALFRGSIKGLVFLPAGHIVLLLGLGVLVPFGMWKAFNKTG